MPRDSPNPGRWRTPTMKTLDYGRMKVKCTHCGRNKDILETLVTLLLAIQTMVPKELEFPQHSHAVRRKRLDPGTSQGRNLSPIKSSHTVLTFQTRRYWTQDNNGSVAGRTTPWLGPLSYINIPVSLFKPKPYVRTPEMNLGVTLDYLISCSCQYGHVE